MHNSLAKVLIWSNAKEKPNDILSVLAINEKGLLSARSTGRKVTLESSDNQLRFPVESFKILD